VSDGSAAAVRATGLKKHFGQVPAVDGIDVLIRPGQCFGFLGPNGAGKTTTMRMLSCLARRDGGELAVLGLDPEQDPRSVKRRLGVVAQEINLDVELTVRENLLVYGRYFGLADEQVRLRADELLAFVQLSDRADWTVDRLSGGMQRRVQIARALINDPALVLLDEPTTGLDPQARHLVWDRLRELKTRGVTLVLTTHYMDEAEQLCDELVVMDHGKVVRSGTPHSLIQQDVGGEVVELVDVTDVDAIETATRPLLSGTTSRGHGQLWLYCRDGAHVAELALAADPTSRRRAIRRATLEDVFLQLTGHALRDAD
jgi:lipooligosaccharide transport system ATP-binding protein